MNHFQETHIRPSTRWLTIDWRGLLEYRDLLWLLIRRDFVSRYKQTILGPAWAILQPVLLSVVFGVVFGRIAKISTDGVPPFLFYLCGLLIWQLFAGILQSAGNSLQGNMSVFSKVYFPRLIPPLATCISQLIPFAIQFIIFIGFYSVYFFSSEGKNFHLNLSLLPILPLLILQAGICGLGVALCYSALTAKYRDFQHALGFMVQVWLYATPVIYPASKLGGYAWIAWFNPIAAPVEGVKAIFLGTTGFMWSGWYLAWLISLSVLLIGIFSYQRTARSFIDTA